VRSLVQLNKLRRPRRDIPHHRSRATTKGAQRLVLHCGIGPKPKPPQSLTPGTEQRTTRKRNQSANYRDQRSSVRGRGEKSETGRLATPRNLMTTRHQHPSATEQRASADDRSRTQRMARKCLAKTDVTLQRRRSRISHGPPSGNKRIPGPTPIRPAITPDPGRDTPKRSHANRLLIAVSGSHPAITIILYIDFGN